MSEFIVTPDKLDSFLPLLGAEVTDEGYIRDIESGEIATTVTGEKITVDEMCYLASGEDGEIIPVAKNASFPEKVESISDRDIR